METIIFGIVVAVAIWYLYRRFVRTVKSENPSCGCGACDSCPAAQKTEYEWKGGEALEEGALCRAKKSKTLKEERQ
jgi:hypothetical protein